jgi:hypothetical protein
MNLIEMTRSDVTALVDSVNVKRVMFASVSDDNTVYAWSDNNDRPFSVAEKLAFENALRTKAGKE